MATVYMQLAKKVGQASRLPVSESKRDAYSTFLEEAADKNLQFMDQVAALPNVDQASRLIPVSQASSLPQGKRDACVTLSDIEHFVATANDPKHPIRNQLLRLTASSPDLFSIIKREGEV